LEREKTLFGRAGDHTSRAFKNQALKRIFGPERDEMTGGWRKLHNEELRNLYSSPNIIRMEGG
jgi:hypothetical protein